MNTSHDPAHFTAVDVNDADFLIGFLDARYDVPGELRVKKLIAEALELRPGLAVLDVGCGTGVDTCALAGAGGSVIGLDSSARMVTEARRRAAETGSAAEFVEGDATALPFPDATFDRCRIERTLMHLESPADAVGEMARVTRPGGVVVASEIDTATAFLGEGSLSWLLEDELVSAFPSSRVGRTLPHLFVDAGLDDVRCVPTVILNSVAFVKMVVGDRVQRHVDSGVVTAATAAEYWAEQELGEKEGWLRTGVTCFTVSGRK